MPAVPQSANLNDTGTREGSSIIRPSTGIHPEDLNDVEVGRGTGSLLRARILREEIISNDEVQSPYAWFFWRYLISVALVMAIVTLAKMHEDKSALTRNQKYVFNSAVIMLTLMFGLNMTIAYSHFVMLVKAGILNRRPGDRNYWPFRYEASFAKLSGLRSSIAFMLRGKPIVGKTQISLFFITMWLIFNLGMGVAIALIGLTYSLDSGRIGRRPGPVSVVDLSGLYSFNKTETIADQDAQRFSAKLYADVSISYPEKGPKEPGEDSEFQLEHLGPAEWRYYFREMDHPGGVIAKSNRSIRTDASCEGYHLIHPEDLIRPAEDSIGRFEKFYYRRGLNDEIQDIGPALWDATSTYYLAEFTPGETLAPGKFRQCGPDTPRCAHIYVAQLVPDHEEDFLGVDFDRSMIYTCNVSVSEVQNAERPEHELSDAVAFSAGSSLAYSGLWGVEVEQQRGLAYSLYPVRSEWGRRAWGNATMIANMISRASIGTIAAMDQLNPRVYVPGMQPWLGEKLTVRWQRLIALLVCLAVVQLIGGVSSILWYRFQLPPHYQAVPGREDFNPFSSDRKPETTIFRY